MQPIRFYWHKLLGLFILLIALNGASAVSLAADGALINAGQEHSCAIGIDGSATCWGADWDGEASPLGGIFTQVGVGANHSCGLRSDGTLACWGDNGSNEADDFGKSTPPSGLFTQLSVGPKYSCAVRTDNAIKCWGGNTVGLPAEFFTASTELPADVYSQVSAGSDHACAIRVGGSADCWGDDEFGQASPPDEPFIQISAGQWHSCGLLNSGALRCWGADWSGQASPPSGVFTHLSSGPYHNCAVRIDGTVACWGDNWAGQSRPPGGFFVQVSAGYLHSCGLRQEGMFDCWGYDDTGRIDAPAGQFTQVSVGTEHSCGLRADGTIACWGSNADNQRMAFPGVFKQISAGAYHGCVIHNDDRVRCRGYNDDGQASPPPGPFVQVSTGAFHTCGLRPNGAAECWGDNTDAQANPPGGMFTQIAAGGFHTCGLRPDGAAECWGDDGDGQATPAGGTFTQLSAGWTSTCGVRNDDIVACWGDNSFGQSDPPTGGFIQVSVGFEFACGVAMNGSMVCWGDEWADKTSPPSISFRQISAGENHACGIDTNGAVKCWGDNGLGFSVVPKNLRGDPNWVQAPVLDYTESHLLNISTNGATDGFGMRAGFIVQGHNQRFVIMGEDMGGMQNPLLKLFNLSDNTLIEQNDDWQNHSTKDEVQASLRDPGNLRDGAFAITLAQGLYYAELQDEGGGGQGLVSVTATDVSNFQQTYPINLSTRGPSPLVAGFIVTGDTSPCFLIKAEGPVLNGNAIRDPALAVRRYDPSHSDGGEIIDANSNWLNHPSATLVEGAGFAPADPNEAALAIRLQQGVYLAELFSIFETETGGDSIVAVTELPQSALQHGSCNSERTPKRAPIVGTSPGPDPEPQQLEVYISEPVTESTNYYINQSIRYVAVAVTNSEGSIDYQWNFGTGAQLNEENAIAVPEGTLQYSQAGEKTIRLTVSVNDLSQTTEAVITVREPNIEPDRGRK